MEAKKKIQNIDKRKFFSMCLREKLVAIDVVVAPPKMNDLGTSGLHHIEKLHNTKS